MSSLHRLLSAIVAAGVLGVPRGAAAQQPDSVPAVRDTAGASGLDGVVVDHLDRPLAGASVFVEERPGYDLSDARGRFALRGLPAGTTRFRVRRVGYKPIAFEVDLPDRATVHVRVRMETNLVTLGAIIVDGQAHSLPLFRTGFYDRAAKQALGYFYPPEEIVRRRLTSLATLLSEVPGLTIGGEGGARIAYGRNIGLGACLLNLWVDGALAGAAPTDLDLLVPGPLVRAVEIYPSATAVPDRYVRNNNRCGALVVWTTGVVRDYF